MDITGFEYFVTSNKTPDIVLKKFNIRINKLWSNCIVYINDELHDEHFFYSYVKDKAMDNFSAENAYQLNQDGEGQISLTCSKINLLKTYVTTDYTYYDNYEETYKYYPKDSILRKNTFILYNIYSYNLILPAIPQHPFCIKIIKILEEAILE